MVARSDSGPIGRSLGYRRYLRLQGLISLLIVLELVLIVVLDAIRAGQMQLRGPFVHRFLPLQAAIDQHPSKIEFECEDDKRDLTRDALPPRPWELQAPGFQLTLICQFLPSQR
jgi:hypothetical protein